MSVEQTTQLIQLILNSVLMSVACAVVLSGLTARYTALSQQLQVHHQTQRHPAPPGPTPLPVAYHRTALRHLRLRYTLNRYGVLAGYYALFLAVCSCFILTLRGLLNWNSLIPIALGCFVLGMATLLLALGLTLVDWHFSDRSLLEETQHFLDVGTEADPRPLRPLPNRAARRSKRDRRSRPKMRVG